VRGKDDVTDETVVEEFKVRLLRLLAERDLTLSDAATKAGIPKSTLHNWTQGSTPSDFEALDRLSLVLGTDLPHLLLGRAARSKTSPVTIDDLYVPGEAIFSGLCRLTITPLVARKGADDPKE
jgi:transcriptional regulator with XRE-family HTH domain